MTELKRAAREDVLAAIADTPATLEFRAIALDLAATCYLSADGLLLVDSCEMLACAMGAVRLDDVRLLYRERGLPCELLADERAADVLGRELRFSPATILSLGAPWRNTLPAIANVTVRPLALDDSLDHLPGELRAEIELWRRRRTVLAGFVDDRAASLAYAPWDTETLADVAVDTLAAYRNRGLGALVASALIDELALRGKQPVWGAAEDNRASLRLANKLGFRHPAGRLFVAAWPWV